MPTKFIEAEPVTLSYSSARTPECIADAIAAFSKHTESAERFTGDFSVDDAGGVRAWGVPGSAGIPGSTHFVCTLHVEANAPRKDVLAAAGVLVENLAEQARASQAPRVEELPAPKPFVKSESAPQHIRVYESGPVNLTTPIHIIPECNAEAFACFCKYAQGRSHEVTGAFSVTDSGRVRDWSTPGYDFKEGETYVLTAHIDADASRADVAASLGALQEQFNA